LLGSGVFLIMDAFRVKVISANDADIFQARMNGFLESLPEDAIIVDIKYTTAFSGTVALYSAMVQYKTVESWG
jgi:Sporulation protein Cse60